MNRDEILELSRRENRDRDYAELEAAAHAGNVAGRVGACACCLVFLLSRWITGILLYSPWIIYFSILGTHYLVKYTRLRKRTDLLLSGTYLCLGTLALIFFVLRLMGERG